MNELKQVWKSNSFKQNVIWVSNILLFLALLPFYIFKEFCKKQ